MNTVPVGVRSFVLSTMVVCLLPALAAAQESLEVQREDGTTTRFPIVREQGHAVVSDEALAALGWRLEFGGERMQATLGDEVFSMRLGSPFFHWNDELLQLVREPYSDTRAVWLPLQLFLDFLPARMPERYASDALALRVRSERGPERTASDPTDDAPVATASGVDEPPAKDPAPAGAYGMVIVDPGHGGKDPGAVGPGGRREKDIALSVGRALARELSRRDGLEVRLTRDRDEFVPLWERGKLATEWKGDLPAVFISIHANSLPSKSAVRGFETYFLSEARTEHEARVAANENAPLAMESDSGPFPGTDDLDFILRELRNRDHMRWSSVLAAEVQRGMETVHPGPNRGVKQAPFAVITNALMPAVLVEVGFVSNANEERLISRGEFQQELAVSIADAVDRFFARYPPGAETAAGGGS